MDLKTIQDRLEKEFDGTDRKLIFWYDGKGEFEQDLESLALKNATIWPIDGNNLFATKHMIEVEKKDENFLIYAPFPKPKDELNHLADMIYYSAEFNEDKISMVCQEIGIAEKYKGILNKYDKFFKHDKYLKPFSALAIEKYTNESIEIGVLAVLTGVKIPNFDEIVKTLILTNDLSENKYITQYQKIGILDSFWNFVNIYYGYKEDEPTLEKFITTLLLTYTNQKYNGNLPKRYIDFISEKRNDIEVFISNLMNNIKCKNSFDQLANTISKKIGLSDAIKNEKIESYLDCDIFEIFDRNIIENLAGRITENGSSLNEYVDVIENRLHMHYADKYKNDYNALIHANSLARNTEAFKLAIVENIDQVIKKYTENWYKIDTAYRKFYYFYDRLNNQTILEELRQHVENVYTNGYLGKLSTLWASQLEKVSKYENIPGIKQNTFYETYVKDQTEKQCTAVIISDALRFECAKELAEKLNGNSAYSADIEYMTGNIPTYTGLGMASLLPNREIIINDNFYVTVDGQKAADTLQRGKILKNNKGKSTAIAYSDLIAMKREQVQIEFNGLDLIYIYHDQIDARGDNSATENEVFAACTEAIDEIGKIVQKLMWDKSITNFIITADHGFIYKRDKLEEGDKLGIGSISCGYKNRRFVLTKEDVIVDGTFSFNMDYLSPLNQKIKVLVPRGADVFKTAGSMNYVHGGASLQELIIPVISLKSDRYKQNTKKVELILKTYIKKITNLVNHFEFVQKDNVSDTILPAKWTVFIENELGERVSTEAIIAANKKDESPEGRTFKEKFVLKSNKYLPIDKYYLVGKDEKNNDEVFRQEVIIDIVFGDDFGFDL